MCSAILVVHFGEPSSPDPASVETYLTRIFEQNANLEESENPAERARELARRRLPGLLDEYEAIGGSPMNEQAEYQRAAVAKQIADRGHDEVISRLGFQFMDPSIETVLADLAREEIDQVITLPTYPLCGPSTTVSAIERVAEGIDSIAGWNPELASISGWHRHPRYFRLRTENITRFVEKQSLNLDDQHTKLVFSAHGTPTYYLEAGSRYRQYVEEVCDVLGGLLGQEDYAVGFQNHGNRDIPWTEPEIETVIAETKADRVVVEPVSFMHEQSETLSELDIDLAEDAAAAGLDFHRVPIPHNDPAFSSLLADLIEPFLAGVAPEYYQLRPCQCVATDGTYCLNASR